MEWGYLVQPVKGKTNCCECTYMIQMDPKGWIPNWLINKLTKNGSNYVQQMRKLVAKEAPVV